jgi:WD40 repeat protein
MKEHKKDLDDGLDDHLGRAVEAICSEPSPTDARRRLLDAAGSWTPSTIEERSRRSRFSLVAAAVAASVLLTVSAGIYFIIVAGHTPEVVVDDGLKTDGAIKSEPGPSVSAGLTASYLNVVVAESAPIMLANGRGESIGLGAALMGLKAGEGSVHIWDWSQSPHSRVLKGVRLLTAYDALSPDGRFLVQANGDILDLKNGERKTIDLGADVRVNGRWDEGLNDIRFSPDGGRLAVIIGNRTDDRKLYGIIRVLDFPTGRLLCQFGASEPFKLRVGFSPDGKQVAAGDPNRQILLRDATTGQIINRYEPALDNQIYSVALSPGGHFVTAADSEGDLLVWESETGRLIHKQNGLGEGIDVGCLKFSPDGKLLAAAESHRIDVYDAATGNVVGQIKQIWPSPSDVRFSADGKTLTVFAGIPSGTEDGRDIYPSVHEWDWKNGKLLCSLDASLARAEGTEKTGN